MLLYRLKYLNSLAGKLDHFSVKNFTYFVDRLVRSPVCVIDCITATVIQTEVRLKKRNCLTQSIEQVRLKN